MPFQPGHKLSLGNGGGRKPKAVEFAQVLEREIAKITDKTLIELANKRVYEHIDKPMDFRKTKDLALPIVLKGMVEKKVNIEMSLEDLLAENIKRKNNES